MASIHFYKSDVILTTNDPKCQEAVEKAFITITDHVFTSSFQGNDNQTEAIGLEETRRRTIKKLTSFPTPSPKKVTYAVGIEKVHVSAADLTAFFDKPYSSELGYDVNVVAMTVFKHGCRFSYVDCIDPDSNDADALYRTVRKCLERLTNVKVLGFDHSLIKVDTVITFGTFDLFHDLHMRLIQHAFHVGRNLLVSVYSKGSKKKGSQEVFLKDSVAHRIQNVAKYAVNVRPQNSKIVVRRMTDKHVSELQRTIRELSLQGTLAVYGGEDQFSEFFKLLDACYEDHIPIVAIHRGDNGDRLCSSDLRVKQFFKILVDHYDVDIEKASPRFWKIPLESLPDAQKYLSRLRYLGNEQAEIWKYNKSFCIDSKITKPISSYGKLTVCLPGRTKCDINRAKKIMRTVADEMVGSIDKTDIYLLCYEENDKTTEYFIDELEKDPDGYFSDDAMILVKTILMPRISEKIRIEKNQCLWVVQKKKDFEKKPLTEISSRLAEITLWGRSRGSVITVEIENAFRFCLLELGYLEEEIIYLGKEIAVLNISNLASLNRGRLFSTISVTGINDNKAIKYIKDFSEMWTKGYQEGTPFTLNKVSQTHLIAFAKIPSQIRTYKCAIRPNEDEIITVSDKDCHYTPLFLAPRIGEDNKLQKFIHDSFIKLISRSPQPN